MLAASWVDTSHGPACLDSARIQAALEKRVGPRAHAEQVTVEGVGGDEVRVALRRGRTVVASRELRVDEASCAAAERSIALLVTSWWKLPTPTPTPTPAPAPAPAPPGVSMPPPAPAPVQRPPSPPGEPPAVPREPEPEPEAQPEPPPPPPFADEPAPRQPARPVEVPVDAPAAEATVSAWRWSLGADGLFVLDGLTGGGLARAAAGRRDGFGATLELGGEGQRLARDDTGLLAVTPWFGTLAADWEHRFSAVHLEASLGVRLYAFAARALLYDTDFHPVTWSAAVAARVAVRVPVWRGLYVVAGVTGGSRFREEHFEIRGADAELLLSPWFGQATLGLGVGSK